MILDSLTKKQFYKFTGSPENWITAIKFMTWGLEEKHRDKWEKIQPGDIFLMHSTSTHTRVKGAVSAIIGFGVVGGHKTYKTNPLWIDEIEGHKNTWPLLVPFSEIYLFSSYFENNRVPAPTPDNISEVSRVSLEILKNARPLSSLLGFPAMGSISSVRPEVVEHIFDGSSKLYVIGQDVPVNDDYISTPLLELDNVKDEERYGTTLQNLDSIKKKTFVAKGSSYTRDPILFERAENAHADTLKKLMDLFKNAGYRTYFNKHVDLFAVKDDKSFLFEVKSNENKNFLSQARKGIVQLFEYEYFEIEKFLAENKTPNKTFKNLVFSREPNDIGYTNFMNALELGVCYFREGKLNNLGINYGIFNI